ncbi:UDP-N-acetylmuramoyl-L-alanyl-D-glutamate--2,6-diaminopimelate ligase [Sediminicola luteus]|uniref:UDP-N-acetylmuramoyl-L-alanyl-D-glutamate--2,6-diaminopimelate ligase n=1 Tax=Sediminicola luteus TaxID=319238 RepID=A0A2A4G5X6_9FLAO|nr:UDP-N-acetylmuramoyl-L-alanyl-D-glutamate--2,6-diaminopimelate ligase [Sediminicola luteus]PCE63390.1 UDP-N-acetylmuramoyl-L-alanyl-D-glutamate--2,6-diaminopimelate ligase [Sediminicola luteus]
MTLIKDILFGVSIGTIYGSTDKSITAIQFDSREVGENDLFVAIKGTLTDGHQYIDKALGLGANCIVCEKLPENLAEDTTYVQTPDPQSALAIMAANYYDNPSKSLKLVGVTGTNGKTTVSSLLYQLFRKAGYATGLISTIKIKVDDQVYPTKHTTPDPLVINKYLAEMRDTGASYCFMEVSSHGLDQKRTDGLVFSGAIFTNLTHDHLDYHKDFAEYRNVKKRLFDQLDKKAFALTNQDDKNGGFMLQNTKATKYGYALKTYTDYRGQLLEQQFDGQLIKINDNEIWSRLIGGFNTYNLLAVYATAELLGLEAMEILRIISELESVDGRFQYYKSPTGVTAIVDYAHTPDALKNVLRTIDELRTGNENVITVVGCGGDRDHSKRPVMGHIASEMSDTVIFTSDNPRSEDPATIINEMEAGVEMQNQRKLLSVVDRAQAIKTACRLAQDKDIVLVAGKGHETYQETQGVRSEFDDFKKIKEALTVLEK